MENAKLEITLNKFLYEFTSFQDLQHAGNNDIVGMSQVIITFQHYYISISILTILKSKNYLFNFVIIADVLGMVVKVEQLSSIKKTGGIGTMTKRNVTLLNSRYDMTNYFEQNISRHKDLE